MVHWAHIYPFDVWYVHCDTYTHAKQKYSTASNHDGQCIQAHGEGKQIMANASSKEIQALSGLGESSGSIPQAPALAIYIVFLGMYLLDSSHSLHCDSNILKAVCTFI